MALCDGGERKGVDDADGGGGGGGGGGDAVGVAKDTMVVVEDAVPCRNFRLWWVAVWPACLVSIAPTAPTAPTAPLPRQSGAMQLPLKRLFFSFPYFPLFVSLARVV